MHLIRKMKNRREKRSTGSIVAENNLGRVRDLNLGTQG